MVIPKALKGITNILKKNANVQRKFLKVKRGYIKNTKLYLKLQKQHAKMNFNVPQESIQNIQRLSRNMNYQNAQMKRFAKQLVGNNKHIYTILTMQIE